MSQEKVQPSEQGKWNCENNMIVLVATYEVGDSFAVFFGEEGNMELTTCSCSSDGSRPVEIILRESKLPSGRMVKWHRDNRFSLWEADGTYRYSTGIAFLPRKRTACDDDHCDDSHECQTGQAHQFGGNEVVNFAI